jgi:hypothetical protein
MARRGSGEYISPRPGVQGYKANQEEFWISGPRRDGNDRLYVSSLPVEIDDDVRDEYWTEIRKRPERAVLCYPERVQID